MENKEVIKVEGKIGKDKVIIFSIIGALVLISVVVTVIFFYNNNYKSLATYSNEEYLSQDPDIYDVDIYETLNKGNVNVSEFSMYYKVYQPILVNYYGYSEDMIADVIINKVFEDKLLLEKAKENNITMSEESQKEYDELLEDEEQTQSMLATGISEGEMKTIYKNDFIIREYLAFVADSLSEEELIEKFKESYGEGTSLESYETSHILIMVSDDAEQEEKDAALEKANNTLERIKNGEDFATVAKEVSDDEGTKENGGKYTMYTDGSTVPEFEEAVKNLEIGSYTQELVKTDYGYHIIKLDSYDEKGRLQDDSFKQNVAFESLGDFSEKYELETNYEEVEEVIFDITGNKIDLDGSDEQEETDIYSE